MKVFLVLSNLPNLHGEAIEVVSYEIVRHLLNAGHKVALQVIWRYPKASEESERYHRALQQLDLPITICPTLYLENLEDPYAMRRGIVRFGHRVLDLAKPERLFPAAKFAPEIRRRLRESRADVILGVWSWEALAATYSIMDVPKFMYYGNPDHKPAEARYGHPALFGIPTKTMKDKLQLMYLKWRNERLKTAHLEMMARCECTANNSWVDAQFYAAHGHPRSIYLQNMWPPVKEDATPISPLSNDNVVKLIGNVGNIGSTGTTFGLYYIGKELLMRLAQRFGSRKWEIHILGRGRLSSVVESYFNDPHVVLRGWVDDIHHEFYSAHAFLVLTNWSRDFLVGNTRLLLAWSLKTCTILHENSVLSMPEVKHEENALLGRTPDEIADQIVRAATENGLRKKIGEGGYDTYQRYYCSDVVMLKMIAELENCVRIFNEKKE